MNLCRLAIVWLFVILMSNVVFAAGKPLVETTKTDVDDQYYLDTVENGHIYVLSNCLKSFCYTEGNEIPKRYYSSPVSCHGTACIYQDFSEETLDSYLDSIGGNS